MIQKGDIRSVEQADEVLKDPNYLEEDIYQAHEILARGGYSSDQIALILRVLKREDRVLNNALKLIADGDRRGASKLLLQHDYDGNQIQTLMEVAVAVMREEAEDADISIDDLREFLMRMGQDMRSPPKRKEEEKSSLQSLLGEIEKVETEFRNLVATRPEEATLSVYQRYKSLLFNVEQKAKDSLEPTEFEQFGKRMGQALQIIRNSYDKHVVRREVGQSKFMKNKSNLEIEKVFEVEPYLNEGIKPSELTTEKNLFRIENILKRNLEPELKVCDTVIKGESVFVKVFDPQKNEFTTFEDNLSNVLAEIKKNITKEEIPSPKQQLAQQPTGPTIKPILAARGYRLVSKEEELAIGEQGLIDPNEKEEKPPSDAAATVEQHVTEKLPLYIIERLEEKLYRLLNREGQTISYHTGFRDARRHLINLAERGQLELVRPEQVKSQKGGENVTQTIRRQAVVDVLKGFFDEDSAKAITAAMIVKSTIYDVADSKQEVESRGKQKYTPDVTSSGVTEYSKGDQKLTDVAESPQQQQKRGEARYEQDVTADPKYNNVYQSGDKVTDRTTSPAVVKSKNFR